jgi:hypothetical protein
MQLHYLLTIKEFGYDGNIYSRVLIGDTQEDIDYLIDMHVADDEHSNVESYKVTEITARESALIQEENLEFYGSRQVHQLNKGVCHFSA